MMKPVNRDVYRKIGLRIQKVRGHLGYTQVEMASKLGVTANAFRKNEDGYSVPGYHSLQKLAMDFDISLDWLYFNKGAMIYNEKQEKPAPPEKPAVEITREPEPRMSPQVKEMVEQMEKEPQLYHEILAFYHRFQSQQLEKSTPKETAKKKK
jgi:transcriptional regulator with XRE-family HTH domain